MVRRLGKETVYVLKRRPIAFRYFRRHMRGGSRMDVALANLVRS